MVAVFPANLSADATRLVYVDMDGSPWCVTPQEATSADVEGTRPVREFFAWPGQRSYQGWWWSSTTRTLLAFESLLERQALMWFDFDPTAVGVAVQPFALLWPGSPAGRGTDGRGSPHHVPDLFVRRSDGTGCVVDVRPLPRIDAKARQQFAQTATVCAEIGWEYRVFTGLPQPLATNLRFISGYRRDRHEATARLREQLLHAAGEPGASVGSIAAGAARLDIGEPESSFSVVYRLLWDHAIHADMGSPLALSTAVWT